MFQVGGVNETILSAGKVVRSNQFRCVLDMSNSYLEHKQSGARIPLHLRRNSFYLKGQVSKVSRLLGHQIAPITEEQAWQYPDQQQEMDMAAFV